MIKITNKEFLEAVFGDEWENVYVTSFSDDPSDIPNDRRAICWGGGRFKDTYLQPDDNQYFCISLFNPDDKGKPRRRKVLFKACHVIVADDVCEKLPIDRVEKLPAPSYKLKSSNYSEQWGWILDKGCEDRGRVENLLDGLVTKGLSPSGSDPGMRGVTRLIRTPNGVNTKAKRIVENFGVAPRVKLIEWHPEVRVTMEELAEPFGIDLDGERGLEVVDGAALVADHPLLTCGLIQVKSVLSPGRYDLICPWVDEHGGAVDDGAAMFTNADGTFGFCCHHGSCCERTGRDLVDWIEAQQPGFEERLKSWQVRRSFDAVVVAADESSGGGAVDYGAMLGQLKDSAGAVGVAHAMLRAVDGLEYADRMKWHNEVRGVMKWTKGDLQKVLDEQRVGWYPEGVAGEFYNDFVYVSEQNQFYNPAKKLWLTPESFQNTFSDQNNNAKTEALLAGKVKKVDRIDYAPGLDEIFVEHGVSYLNAWTNGIDVGVKGDGVERWLSHFETMGWSEHRDHMLKWMAFTLKYPERKINHIMILGGGEGNGKDFILYPLVRAMKNDTVTIDGDDLLEKFNGYLFGTKYLHINETDLGDRKEAIHINNKLKRIATSPPDTLRLNEKYIKNLSIRNIVNVTMTTNSPEPVKVISQSRRYYAVWTDLSIRGEDGQVTEEWKQYWEARWNWIRDQEGWKVCVWYLMNEVDLTGFDPKETPVVTEYMKEIQESSQDPISAIIQELVELKRGVFVKDILTPVEIFNGINQMSIADLGVNLKNTPSSRTIGKIIKRDGLAKPTQIWDGRTKRAWIIRNFDKYKDMSQKERFIACKDTN